MLCLFFWGHREGGVKLDDQWKWSSVQATERLLHWNMWQQTSMNILLVPKEPKENEPWCFQSSARNSNRYICQLVGWSVGMLPCWSSIHPSLHGPKSKNKNFFRLFRRVKCLKEISLKNLKMKKKTNEIRFF